MTDAIHTTIDDAGRIVIPKPIRDAAGLSARDVVVIRLADDGIIELRPLPRAVRIDERDGIRVAVRSEPGESLTQADVSATRSVLRGD